MTRDRTPTPSIDFGYPTPAGGPVPEFNSIEEEAEFWDTHDVTDLVKKGTEPIELMLGPDFGTSVTGHLGRSDRDELDRRAEELGVEHATLIRMWIEERLHKEAS
jgi:hypothetical protein